MAKKRLPKKQIVSPRAVAAFAWFHKPDTGHKYSNNKYKSTLVFDDDTIVGMVEEHVETIVDQMWGEDGNEPKEVDVDDVKRPYKTPEDQTKEEFEGKHTMNVSSKYQPKVVDGKRKALPKGVEARSGDIVKCIIELIPYESTEKVKEGKKTVTVPVYGISAQLAAVQLLEKRNGGGADTSMFDEEEDGFDADEYAGQFANEEDDGEDETDEGDGDY